MQQTKLSRLILSLGVAVGSISHWTAMGQGLQNSGLVYMQTIPVPNWKVGTSNTDVFGFNPVTRAMYLADRTNHGVDVINTRDNAFLGIIPMASNSVPNVPLVVIDRQELVVSDGLSSVYVWNLRVPMANLQPDQYIVAGTTTDGIDYDPINQTIYVVTQ